MRSLSLSPTWKQTADRLTGRTPLLARALLLFSYERSVIVDRRQRSVEVTTRRCWAWHSRDSIGFDRIEGLFIRGDRLPGLGLWTALFLGLAPFVDVAFFLVILRLDDPRREYPLCTVWEEQPGGSRWFSRLGGEEPGGARLGDERVTAVAKLLGDYLGRAAPGS